MILGGVRCPVLIALLLPGDNVWESFLRHLPTRFFRFRFLPTSPVVVYAKSGTGVAHDPCKGPLASGAVDRIKHVPHAKSGTEIAYGC